VFGDGGVVPQDQCNALCNPTPGQIYQLPESCTFEDYQGVPSVLCTFGPCVIGRRPEGLESGRFDRGDSVARYLAEAAYLEAASVDAFKRMARELEAHHAPQRLVAAARRAARDEVRHARVMRRFAERAGASVPACRVARGAVRSLEEIAVENAAEGCVRETFGAAVGLRQAERAASERLRRTMARIAADETRHAELGWAVAAWLDSKLDAPARARVARARTHAIETLARETANEPDAALVGVLGLPNAHQAQAAFAELRRALWGAQAA
jgi:hypothetical protein